MVNISLLKHIDLLDIFLLCIIVGHVLITPFTKVEETFQVNNMYDHIYLMTDIKNYDFQEFPGVVDRTFISSLLITFFAFPLKYIFEILGISRFYMLYVTRIILGVLNFIALKILRNSI